MRPIIMATTKRSSLAALAVLLFSSQAIAALVDGIESVYPLPGETDVNPATALQIEYVMGAGYGYTDLRKLRVIEAGSGIEVFQIDPEAGDPQEHSDLYSIALPPGTLEYGKSYVVEVDRGFAVLNAAPWKSGRIDTGVWTFSTSQLVPAPISGGVDNIQSVFPAPGATLVPVDTPIVLEMDGPAYYSYTDNSYIAVVDAETRQVVFEQNPEGGDVQEGNSTYTVNLAPGTLKPNRTYEVTVDYGFASINIDPWKTGAIGNGIWTFKTTGTPSQALATDIDGIRQVSPASGTTGLDPDDITLSIFLDADSYFDNTDGSELKIFELGESEPVFQLDPSPAGNPAGSSRLDISVPTDLLKEDTQYTVTLDYQMARLTEAPWRTGLLEAGGWNFITGKRQLSNLDPIVAGVVGVYPAPSSTEVNTDTDIIVYFSTRSYFGYTDNSELRLIDTRSDSVVASANPGYQDSQENKLSYSLKPPTPLEPGVTYRVEADYGFVRFNDAPWIMDAPLEWQFTVEGVLTTAPTDEDPTDNGDAGNQGDNDNQGDANDNTDSDNNNDGSDGANGDGGAGNENNDGNDGGDGGDSPGDSTDNTPPENIVSSTTGTVMFVTQTPLSGLSFGTVISNFSNHVPTSLRAPRGGDLWIRYPDGTLRNLTEEAGFGNEGLQGTNAIAVRSPSVHWNGNKALFSMVVGSPDLFETTAYYWQIYEVTGLGQHEAVTITKVANQPADYNNVAPIYAATNLNGGTEEDIIFESDITPGGRHLYPQYEEYDGAPTNTGLFRLNRSTGELKRLTHAPSGDFTPIIDSFGRMIFTRWDHLQQDQQNGSLIGGLERFGAAINYVDESVGAPIDTVNGAIDIFPEHLVEVNPDTNEPYVVGNETGMRFNQFFLWESSPLDGSENEVLNHLGRQELGQSYTRGRFVDDSALTDITTSFLGGHTANSVPIYAPGGVFHAKEDPNSAGTFYMTHAQEFAFCGEILTVDAAPGVNPEDIVFQKRTDYFDSDTIDGCYRNPLTVSDGVLIASYAPGDFANNNEIANTFRLHFVNEDGTPGAALTNGIGKSVAYWSPDYQISHTGNMWELDAVEVRARPKPTSVMHASTSLAAPEQAACEAAYNQSSTDCELGMTSLRQYLADNKLALVVTRNVTSRDDSDTQQPFNLRVPGGVVSDASQGADTLYDVTHLQFLQANLVRGYANRPNGRRPLAQYIADSIADGLNGSTNGALDVKADGSVAAIVPAERAVTWHLIDDAQANKSIVSERYWVSFAAGEVRVCANCHGINKADQMGNPEPTNAPQALTDLLQKWRLFSTDTSQDP